MRSWEHAVRKLSIPISYTANLTRPANAKQSARSLSEQEGSAKSHVPRLSAPKPGHWHLIPAWRHYLIAQELQLQDLKHLTSQMKQSCICKSGLRSLLPGKSCNYSSRALYSWTFLWIHLLIIIPLQSGDLRDLSHISHCAQQLDIHKI